MYRKEKRRKKCRSMVKEKKIIGKEKQREK
jgi:hypothetical protein